MKQSKISYQKQFKSLSHDEIYDFDLKQKYRK